ncbi:MAG TPA: fructokinase, partial [Citrobacter freundii]|nr:fructokinase [Citrobacter freundii]
MIISTALSLNPAGMIANCRYACIVNREEEQTVRIGIDLGGTKTEVIALGDAGG